VLLDIKYTDDDLYIKNVGCSLEKPIQFLYYLNEQKIPVTLRQVIIPTLNDNEQNIEKLNDIIKNHSCIDKAELLPFKKICQTKYDNMQIKFPFEHIPTPTKEMMNKLNELLK
jgi:pyruvate formate lyase activating enzyme